MPNLLAPPLIEHRDAIAALCRAYAVERLEVFGSAADGRFDPERSDFDFIASFSPEAMASPRIGRHFLDFVVALETLLGRHVDLLTNQPVRNRFLREAIDASRHTIYDESTAEAS